MLPHELDQKSCESLESEAILRITSYHRKDFDVKVVSAEPGQHDHARSSLFKSFDESASSGLGRLQRLPLELLSSICLLLDVQSALNFSQASRSARETIGSIPQYHRLREHSLECIWALSRTGLSHHTSVSYLHAALLTELCVICGSFGGFLFLPSASRCCFACIESAPDFRIISFHSLQRKSRRLATLVSGHHAMQFPRADRDEDPRVILGKLPDSPALRCMAACRLPYFNLATGDLQWGICCKGCQIAMQANYSDANFSRRERLYSRDGFMRHFWDCVEAKELWASSEGGMVAVTEPEFTRRGGL
ncbi:F-box domain-containing protein [Xylariomycetidae sp. FL2044]|nr:F-box domain-containing protein [Xylariomycetidae sp. FL2044]